MRVRAVTRSTKREPAGTSDENPWPQELARQERTRVSQTRCLLQACKGWAVHPQVCYKPRIAFWFSKFLPLFQTITTILAVLLPSPPKLFLKFDKKKQRQRV